MRNELKKGLLNILDKTAKVEVQKSTNEKWPICPLILHQPKRPKNS